MRSFYEIYFMIPIIIIDLLVTAVKFQDNFQDINNNSVTETNRANEKLNKQLFFNFNQFKFPMPKPWDIETIKPKIVFYKHGQGEYEVNHYADPKTVAFQLKMLNYLETKRLILIVHGFHNDFNTSWMHDYKEKIFNISTNQKVKQTIAILGWGGGANILVFRYRQAASNVLTVGNWLANFIKAIKDVKPNIIIYGIGHSLGSHVIGIAGRVSKGIHRITGLDPAGPCFEKVPNSQTLRASDAKFVDVIHTDGYDSKFDPTEWFFPVNHYGSLVPIGKLDFYPNYGYHQPGAGTFTVAGSHLRALDLFEWSIMNRGKFITDHVLSGTPDFNDPINKNKPTKYKAEMGFYADRWPIPPINVSTLYYIKTNKAEPWV